MEVQSKSSRHMSVWNRYLFWFLLIQTLTALAYYGYVPLIPMMEKEFFLTKTQVGYMTSAVFLGAAIIAIPSGIITDKMGTRKTLFLFMLLLGLVTGLFFFSTSYMFLLILLFLLGCGYGGITPATNKGIMENFPIYNRGTAMGLKQTGVSLGSVLGTLMLPILASYFGWKGSLLIISVLIFALCILHFKILKENKGNFRQQRLFHDIIEVIKNKKMIKIISIIVIFIWVQLSVMTYIVLFMLDVTKGNSGFSLFCLALLQFGGAVGRASWGAVSDRFFNRRRGIILGMIGTISSILLFLLSLFSENPLFLILSILSLLLGILTQGWNGIFVLLISEVVKEKQIGIASGLGLSIVYLGAIIGTPISGLIIDYFGGYKAMWLACSILIFIVGIITLFMKLDHVEEAIEWR